MVKIPHYFNAISSQNIVRENTIVVKNPPKSLLELPSGAIIKTQVISNSSDGVTKLESIFGQLTVKTTLTLPRNSSLELQLSGLKPQVQFLIKKIDQVTIKYRAKDISTNRALEISFQQHPKIENNKKNRSHATSSTIKLNTGANIHATLLRPNINSLKDTILLQSQSGVETEIRVTKEKSTLPLPTKREINKDKNNKISTLDSGFIRTIVNIFQGLKAINKKYLDTNNTTNEISNYNFLRKIQHFLQNDKKNKPPNSMLFEPGTKLVLNFIGTDKNKSETSRGIGVSRRTINGSVVATTPTGQPIIHSNVGMLALEGGVRLEIGLNVFFEIIPNEITKPIISSSVMRFKNMFYSKEWPTLMEAISEIESAAPTVSSHLTNTKLPQFNTQLTTNILFFLNALKGGDIRTWIGSNASNILAQNNPQLLSQLSEEFALISHANSDQQSNEWRSAIIPFQGTTGLEQFILHTKMNRNKNHENKENNSRFIIDISLSRLGRFQMDGFLRKKRKRLDLIVRAQNSLPKQMRHEISRIYSDFSKISKINGKISFQVNQRFVEIGLPQVADNDTKGVVI